MHVGAAFFSSLTGPCVDGIRKKVVVLDTQVGFLKKGEGEWGVEQGTGGLVTESEVRVEVAVHDPFASRWLLWRSGGVGVDG
jgi:hypothetical protein